LLESLQGQGLIQGFFSKTLPSPTPEQREALRSILENLPRPESRADILKTIVETSVKTSHSETGAMQTMDASSKTLAVNTSDAANLRTDLTTSTFSQTAVTVNDIEELLEQNVGLGGGYLQGFVGVTTDLTENIYSRIVHQFNAQALITSLVFPDAEASESFTFASAPEAFKRVAQFNDARKVLGWKTLTASDALVLGPEFAFDHGAIAVIRTVFGNIPAAVIVRSEKDAQMVDEINAKLIEANRPPILKAKDVQDAKARLKAEAVRLKTATVSALTFKAMVFANEPMMALLKEQLPDTMVVTPERFQNFLNLAGDRIHVLVQEVQSRFVLERAA